MLLEGIEPMDLGCRLSHADVLIGRQCIIVSCLLNRLVERVLEVDFKEGSLFDIKIRDLAKAMDALVQAGHCRMNKQLRWEQKLAFFLFSLLSESGVYGETASFQKLETRVRPRL